METPLDMKLVAQTIEANEKFVISTHEKPDGDAIGSTLALAYALAALGKDIVVVHAEGTPAAYPFLGQQNWLTAVPADVSERCAIAVDSAQRNRVAADERFDQAQTTVNIDHHDSNTRFAHVNWVQADAAATCEMLPDLFELLGVEIDRRIAAAVYTGIYTDTGGLKFSNTNEKSTALLTRLSNKFDLADVVDGLDFKPDSWKLYAALAASRLTDQGDGIASIVMTAADLDACGVDPADGKHAKDLALARLYDPAAPRNLLAFVYELADGSRMVSMRSDQINSAEIAKQFGGGGHQAAAGFDAPLDGDEMVTAIVAAARTQLDVHVSPEQSALEI